MFLTDHVIINDMDKAANLICVHVMYFVRHMVRVNAQEFCCVLLKALEGKNLLRLLTNRV